jgi:hypothetical protein
MDEDSLETLVEVRAGRLHVPAQTYERVLDGFPAVALLARDDGWWLIPLKAGAGGLPLKQRNARGDRVIEAQEFLRSQGVDDAQEPMTFSLEFDTGRGAYRFGRTR